MGVDVDRAVLATLGLVTQKGLKAVADPQLAGRQVQQLDEPAVEGGHRQAGVDDADALSDRLEDRFLKLDPGLDLAACGHFERGVGAGAAIAEEAAVGREVRPRSEARRVGKEWVRSCNTRGST